MLAEQRYYELTTYLDAVESLAEKLIKMERADNFDPIQGVPFCEYVDALSAMFSRVDWKTINADLQEATTRMQGA